MLAVVSTTVNVVLGGRPAPPRGVRDPARRYHSSNRFPAGDALTNSFIDLRSDTLTTPTPAMRRAMAEAEVGDDVFGEDPTVRSLEERCAEMFGMEAGLLVASGTQGNLCSLLTHCRPRQEVIVDGGCHVVTWEVGGWASLAGVTMASVDAPGGVLTSDLIRGAVKPGNVHLVDSRLVWIENTHNTAGGTCTPPERMAELTQTAHDLGLRVHVDGARIFNAAAALECSVADLAQGADSVQFCLSKGLGAPVGSLLLGSRDYIVEARRVRKMVGGGMRQAGVLAAAGHVALDEIPQRLPQDHANARLLAELLSDTPGLTVDPDGVATNLVFFDIGCELGPPTAFEARLAAAGVRVVGFDETGRCRAVTYHQVSTDDIQRAAAIIHDCAENPGG